MGRAWPLIDPVGSCSPPAWKSVRASGSLAFCDLPVSQYVLGERPGNVGVMAEGFLDYRRAKFSARLEQDRLYTRGHHWLLRQEGRLWRVGLTAFAVRMLGEPVELDFEVEPGVTIEAGEAIGRIEGFKAVADLVSPLAGVFGGANPILRDRIDLIHSDPQGEGWLYALEGEPGEDCLDVREYARLLDATIDQQTRSCDDGGG
jgi:glycine cleavage system H protein